jgi:hypothetical protein
MPSRNLTAEMLWIVSQRPVKTEHIPKAREIAGINQPGPIHLQARFAGISKRM